VSIIFVIEERIARMADVGAVVAEPSARTFEDAIVAMNTLITRKADMPPVCPSTGALNYVAHFQALFHCIEVRFSFSVVVSSL